MDAMIQKVIDGLTGALQARLDALLSSWGGLLMVMAALGLVVFPMARRIWKTSRYAAVGVALLVVAAVVFRPASAPRPAMPEALAQMLAQSDASAPMDNSPKPGWEFFKENVSSFLSPAPLKSAAPAPQQAVEPPLLKKGESTLGRCASCGQWLAITGEGSNTFICPKCKNQNHVRQAKNAAKQADETAVDIKCVECNNITRYDSPFEGKLAVCPVCKAILGVLARIAKRQPLPQGETSKARCEDCNLNFDVTGDGHTDVTACPKCGDKNFFCETGTWYSCWLKNQPNESELPAPAPEQFIIPDGTIRAGKCIHCNYLTQLVGDGKSAGGYCYNCKKFFQWSQAIDSFERQRIRHAPPMPDLEGPRDIAQKGERLDLQCSCCNEIFQAVGDGVHAKHPCPVCNARVYSEVGKYLYSEWMKLKRGSYSHL